jgi:splicing factor 3B subunit 1
MDHDPTKSEISQKLTSYMTPQWNRKMWPKDIGEKEEVVNLKQPQRIIDREENYRKRRLTNYFSSEKRCFPPQKHTS